MGVINDAFQSLKFGTMCDPPTFPTSIDLVVEPGFKDVAAPAPRVGTE